jgi:DNA-binding LacI/PurR family transcriptional regulator
MEAMGAQAAKIVIEGIHSVLEKREVSAYHRKVRPELVVRESTRRLR